MPRSAFAQPTCGALTPNSSANRPRGTAVGVIEANVLKSRSKFDLSLFSVRVVKCYVLLFAMSGLNAARISSCSESMKLPHTKSAPAATAA